MVIYKARIKGARKGLLLNPMTDTVLEELRTKVRKPKVRDWSVTEEAQTKLIKSSDGKLGLPDQYLWAALVEAGRRVKIDAKRSISTTESSLLGGLIDFAMEGEFFPFLDPETKWVPTKMAGKNPADGVAVCIVRPLVRHWEIEVPVEVDEKEIAPEKIRDLFRIAGQFVGLGDFRVSCKGRFGKFTLESWDLQNGAATKRT